MPEMNHTKIPKRVLSGLLASISAGVVPRMGAPYIAIGRNDEIEALLGDLEAVNDGGGSMRFIIGKYGSGKYGNAREHTKYTFLTQEIYATCKISYQKTFHNRNQNQRISYITLPPFKLYYYPPFSFPFSAFFGDGNTLQRP